MAAVSANRYRKSRLEVLPSVYHSRMPYRRWNLVVLPRYMGRTLEEIAEMFGDADELKVEPVIDSEQATFG